MARIAIVTAVYKRPEITEIVLAYYAKLSQESKHEIILIAVGSEGDTSRSMCERNNWTYIEFPNFTDDKSCPLSFKFNALFEKAKEYNPDLVVLTGSDDLISPEIIDFYARTVSPTSEQLHGLADLYIYSAEHKRTVYFGGYKSPVHKTIGAGRCFPRRVLEIMNWQPWQREKMNRGLDSTSSRQMKNRGITEVAYLMSETGGCAVDIKDADISLTPWDRFAGASKNCTDEALRTHFPVEMSVLDKYSKKSTFENDKFYWVEIDGRKQHHRGDAVKRFMNKGMINGLIN